MFLTVTTLPQYWQLTLLPTPPLTSTPTRPTPSAPSPFRPTATVWLPPSTPPPPTLFSPPSPVIQPPPRPARPTMTEEGALRRHLQATVLARKPPMHHTSPSQLSTCNPHTYTSNPHSLSSRSSQASPLRLPKRTHAPAVFHTHPDDPFSLPPISSIRSCHSLNYQHLSNLSPLHSKSSSYITQSSSFSQAPCLPLPTSCPTQALPFSPVVRLSSFIRISCPTLSSTLFSIFHCTIFSESSLSGETFATSSHPSSTTLSLDSQTVTHFPHTLAQSSPCHLLDNLVFFSCSFTFAMQKFRHSSYWSLLLSSNFPSTSFIAFTLPSTSSFFPTIVVS